MRKLIVFLLCSGFVAQGNDYDYFQLENRIEEYIKSLIKEHITPDEYIVIVKIDPEFIKKQSKGSKSKDTSLPYSALQINPDMIRNSFNFNSPDKLFTVPLSVEVIFDERVFDEKQDIIIKKLKSSLKLESNDRKLVITKAKLINTASKIEEKEKLDPNESLQIEMESVRLESQRAQLAAERDRLRAQNERQELEQRLAEEQKKRQEDQKKFAEEKEKILNDAGFEDGEKPKSMLDWFSEFQMAIFAALLSIALLLFVLIGSTSLKAGSKTISTGMTKMGETLATALKTDSSAAAGGVEDIGQEETEDIPPPTNEHVIDERTEKFLVLVEEKVSLLTKEGNFGFYRNFIDLVDSKISYAAAILVSVETEVAKQLVSNISVEAIAKVQAFLGESDGLSKAKSARKAALESFFGSIAMDEFTDSPLMQLKEMSWLTKLTIKEFSQLVLQLNKQERTKFLACFTPTRVSMTIDHLTEDGHKDQIMESLVDIDSVVVDDVEGLFVKVQELYEQQKSATEDKVRKLVDGPRYVAKIISAVGPENRSKLMAKLSERADFMEAVSQYYIPFGTVKKLADRMLSDIFSKRPASQVALAVYDADDGVRDIVISSMPEMLQDSVREELDTLVEDEGSDKKNRFASQKIQDEICRYLLMLNRDGLLEYRDEAA